MSNLATVQFRSEAMNKDVTYNVILPTTGDDGPYPVLLQLHGLGDDCNAWIQRSNLMRHVERYPMAVVLPDGGTSGYANWKSSDRLHRIRYEDLIMTDIWLHVTRHFAVNDGPWAIGGLSMGGYGAMRLGLKYPERFTSIWAHSSAFHIDGMVAPNLIEDVDDGNVYAFADRVKARGEHPVIAFDCGVDDQLIEHNRALHAHMERIGLPHHYAEHPGAHTWDYWDDHVREALAQHARVLGIEPVP